ncbi:unnamed protein product [Meganyctiphanes norvegica]|uniref:Fibronectin type-III domain-containing protein n=1 Tax=Meganyctiphanes norvegica TaxID=48144 RepID=A0AAV2PI21_MEGNR
MASPSSTSHPSGFLAPRSSLLPLLFLLLLAPHISHPQDIEDFSCWESLFGGQRPVEQTAANQSQAKRGTTTNNHSSKECGNQPCVSTIIYPFNLNNMMKGDIKNKIGSKHEVYCRFNSSVLNAEDIYFQIKNRSNSLVEKLPHKVVNDSTISALIPADHMFEGRLECKKEGQPASLCTREMKIGYEPQDVENFTCISDNWESMNCTWDVPKNPLKVDYTLTYVVPKFMNRTMCPQDIVTVRRTKSKKRNWCFWSITTQPQFLIERQHMIFTIHGENIIGSRNYSRDIDIYQVVRPKPPDKIKTNVTGPYSVTIEWMLPYPMNIFPGDVRYEISAQRSYSEDDNVHNNDWTLLANHSIDIDTHSTESSPHSVPLQLRYANMDYEIRVRLHTGTGPIREHMWSTPMIKTIHTLSTKPTAVPETIRGMFEVHNSLDKRDIYIFWQKIDPLQKNGNDFQYIVEAYDESDMNITEKYQDSSFVVFENLNFDSYRFVITPSNEKGKGENYSEVYVPRKTDIQDNTKTFNVIAREPKPEGTVHTVSWSLKDEEPVQSVTIFWCKKSGYEYRCKNRMKWQTINWSEMLTKVKNLTLENGTQYAFGIAVTKNNVSSGIEWIRCVASSGNEPPKVDVLTDIDKSANSVTLKWEMGCGDKAAIPIGVNISYCEIAKTEVEHNLVDSQEAACKDGNKTFIAIETNGLEANIENLHPFTKYRFSIAVLTKVGQGKWSDAYIVETNIAPPSGPPLDFHIYEKGSNWVMFKWKPPKEIFQNGEIKRYELKTDPCDVQTQKAYHTDRSFPFIQFNITGLQSYKNYTFELAACTIAGCGAAGASKALVSGFTRTGVPGLVSDMTLDTFSGKISFEVDAEKAWKKMYQLRYSINDTDVKTLNPSENEVLQIPDWQKTCIEDTKVKVEVRVINIAEDFLQNITGAWKEYETTCQPTGEFLQWWEVVLIILGVLCGMLALGWIGYKLYRQAKSWCEAYRRDLKIPLNCAPEKPVFNHSYDYNRYHKVPPNDSQQIPNKIDAVTEELNHQTEIADNRSGRNPSGESVNSEAETTGSSGCSTGAESDSFSDSHRVTPESEAANGQEDEWNSGLRHRTSQAPAYVQIMPDKLVGVPSYVSVGSVPNLREELVDGTLSLPQSTPNLSQDQFLLTQLAMTAPRRTSTGYISMPDADADSPNINLNLLGNILVRPSDTGLTYSRHNYNKAGGTPDFLAYSKSGSLPRLNTGYVAVAQVPFQIQNQVQAPAAMAQMPSRGDSRDSAQSRAYVQLGEDIEALKRPPSLPIIPNAMNKSFPTPDDERPTGAYCKVGSRMSPGPVSTGSGGYVSTAQAMAHMSPRRPTVSPPISKSHYVTTGQASNITSPSRESMAALNPYHSVSDGERWALRCPAPSEDEDNRKSQSAPTERPGITPPTLPSRPNTSEATVGRVAANQWPPSLSKQSSGYVSQETIQPSESVTLCPKTLVAQNHEPQSVLYSGKHNVSMV